MTRIRSRRGYTLIEAIIAFTLFTTLMVSLAQLQSAARQVVSRLQGPASMTSDLNAAFRWFARDCAHFITPGFLTKGEPVVDLCTAGGEGAACEGGSYVQFWTVEYVQSGFQEIRSVKWQFGEKGLRRISSPITDVQSNLPPPSRPPRTAYELLMAPGATSGAIALHNGQQFEEIVIGLRGVPSGVRLKFSGPFGPQVWARLFQGQLLDQGGS